MYRFAAPVLGKNHDFRACFATKRDKNVVKIIWALAFLMQNTHLNQILTYSDRIEQGMLAYRALFDSTMCLLQGNSRLVLFVSHNYV